MLEFVYMFKKKKKYLRGKTPTNKQNAHVRGRFTPTVLSVGILP